MTGEGSQNEGLKIPTRSDFNMLRDEAELVATGAKIHDIRNLLGALGNLLYLIEHLPSEEVPGVVEEYRQKEREVRGAINKIRLGKL